MKSPSVHHRGYVLLTTLALLVLASTLLVAVGRCAVNHALLSRQTQEELQRKWGIISARTAILPYSDQILAQLESGSSGSVPAYRAHIQLGDSRYTLIISDEQAKANVNALLDDGDKSDVENRMREALAGIGVGNSIFLRPSPEPQDAQSSSPPSSDAPTGPTPWITGLGQIFNQLSPEKLSGGDAPSDFGAAADITCWGDGAVNIMRAPESALRLALGGALTKIEISRLVTQRDALTATSRTDRLPSDAFDQAGSGRIDPDPINRLLNSARIDAKKRGQLPLTTHSTCFSLWIIATDRQRSWTSLYVSDSSRQSKTQTESFVW